MISGFQKFSVGLCNDNAVMYPIDMKYSKNNSSGALRTNLCESRWNYESLKSNNMIDRFISYIHVLRLRKKLTLYLLLLACFLIIIHKYIPINYYSPNPFGDKGIHISDGHILKKLTPEYINETVVQQEYLSRVLFWGYKSHEYAYYQKLVSETHIIQRNFAILEFYTTSQTKPIDWQTYTDFSVSSTAFTQLYYLSYFKPNLYSDIQQIPPINNDLIETYEHALFPWLKSNIIDIYQSFKGRGIVITTGNNHFQYAFLLIKTLRNVLNCNLPIELIYANHHDLSVENRKLVNGFSNIVLIDLSERIDVSQLALVKEWDWKAFTILMSTFTEIIFIEADVLFTVNPEILFEHPNYSKYGHVIYRDRRIVFGIYIIYLNFICRTYYEIWMDEKRI